MSFETIKEFYELDLWDAQQLQQLVQAGGLTAEQYQEITSQVYPTQGSKVIKETQPKATQTSDITQSTGSLQHTGVAQG